MIRIPHFWSNRQEPATDEEVFGRRRGEDEGSESEDDDERRGEDGGAGHGGAENWLADVRPVFRVKSIIIYLFLGKSL